jgi:hypothetical protein
MNERDLILEVIQQTLDAINEQDAVIRLYKGQIPQIELDIIMDNIRKLYENYYNLNKFNRGPVFGAARAGHHEEPPVAEAKPVTTEPAETSGQNIFPSHEEIEIGFETREEKKGPEEEAMVVQAGDVTRGTTGPLEEKEVTTEEREPVEQTLDLFAGQPHTVAETFKPTHKAVGDVLTDDEKDRSIAARIQQSPITDLKSFIGINDRFIFMNELFGGNMKSYDEAINKLNAFTTLEEAMTYFRWLKEQFRMNEKLDSYRRLNEFIHRKYKK